LREDLARFWGDTFPADDKPYTSVVVPSLTLDTSELAKIVGVAHYEERLLFLLMRLRNPYARLVYVTSQPIHPLVLEYYLQLLAGVPASHARSRLTLLSVQDSSSVSLTEKILARPRLIERIRVNVPDRSRAYLTTFNSTPHERRLAVLLGIPLNGADPSLAHHGTKSGSRRLFTAAGVEHPDGAENLRDVDDVREALLDLRARRPALRRAVVKLDASFSGEGNAVVGIPADAGRADIERALRSATFCGAGDVAESYWQRFGRMGGVVEELIEGDDASSPSVQIRVNPRGECFVASTHEQVLGGPTGQAYLGCRFPAREAYRSALQQTGLTIGRVLAEQGVVGRFSVDFLARRGAGVEPWRLDALEINLRMGGATHPMFALRFLTGGNLEAGTGLFLVPDGTPRYYRATDDLVSPRYVGLLPEDLVEILTLNRLDFRWNTATGVLFHMIGAVSQYGKCGVVAIGSSPDDAEAIFRRTVEILDHETRFRAPAMT
jgi:PGM1 C-terminal domain